MRARALLVAALCSLAFPAGAWAHATLVRTIPEDRAVLATAPAAVRIVFDDDVRARSGIRAVRNGGGSVLAGQPRVVDGKVLVVPLRSGLPDGDYTVLWRALSDDGHELAGVVTFAVGVGRSPPVPALSVGSGPETKDVVARWLFFAGLLTAAGAAFFRFAVGRVQVRLLLFAFLLVFVGVSGMLHDASLSTRFGATMAVTAIVAAVGALCAAVASVYPLLELPAFVAALVLVPMPSIAGHALDRGRSPVEFVADVAHVAAASVWLGGLIALALALRQSERAATLRRFSNIAFVSVLVLALTGVVRALSELDSVSQLWTTGYGRVLFVKTGLLATLVAIGWLNRYRLVPRLAATALRRSVAAELLLFIGLVAAVALLTDLRPGRDRVAAAATPVVGPPPLPARQMVVQAQQAGNLAVALAVRPPGAEVLVLGPDGNGVNGLSVLVNGIESRACGPGCYGVFTQLRGKATVSVAGKEVRFDVPEQVRPAASLVARATRAFRALRSVDFVERLASSERNRVVADFTLERPDKLEYRIRDGADGIIIGARRWDRTRGRDWLMSPQQRTPQPEPIWAGRVTNAYVLETTPSSYVVSFMKPLGPTWFTVRFDRRTLLPRFLRMTTAAHFMTHRYTRFNAALRIKPPS